MAAPETANTWVPIVVALISLFGVAFSALLAWLGGLNRRLRRLENRDRLSWIYIRSLIDHAYKHAPSVPLPEPPDGWLDGID